MHVNIVAAEFAEASAAWAGGAIDILHVDGYHSMEATLHAFHAWKVHLSGSAIVLFHDILSYPMGAGMVCSVVWCPY